MRTDKATGLPYGTAYKQRLKASGKCTECGKPRTWLLSESYCPTCLISTRLRQRQRMGQMAYAGKRGRRPYTPDGE